MRRQKLRAAIMLARIEEDAEKDERWHNQKEMQIR